MSTENEIKPKRGGYRPGAGAKLAGTNTNGIDGCKMRSMRLTQPEYDAAKALVRKMRGKKGKRNNKPLP